VDGVFSVPGNCGVHEFIPDQPDGSACQATFSAGQIEAAKASNPN